MMWVRSAGARLRAPAPWGLFTLVLGLLGQGCSHPDGGKGEPAPEAPVAPHVDEKGHPGIARKFRLADSVIADARIRTEPVAPQRLTNFLSLPGEVASNPDRSARVSSPIAGRLERVDFKEGTSVKKGDVLALVRIPELGKLRAAYLEAIARAKAAKVTEKREADLWAVHATSERSYLDAKMAAETTQAEADGLGAQLSALGAGAGAGAATLTLRAPIDGYVVRRNAVLGQAVTTDQTLGTIVDLTEVWFLARVFEKDLSRVVVGAKAEVSLNAYPSEPFLGVVVDLGREVDPVARTLTARIVLTNRGDLLRVGLFGTAAVTVADASTMPPSLVVRRSAIAEIDGRSVVFVREADGDFEMHDVVLGAAAFGKVEIVAGLREGELVVVEGVFTLKSVALKSSLEEDEP